MARARRVPGARSPSAEPRGSGFDGRATSAGTRRAGEDAALAGVSVVVPAFDEAEGIADCLRELRRVLEAIDRPYEILVVDDGSSDGTAEIAAREGAEVWSLPENRGYGAALKEGFARARHDLVVIIDADGSYPVEAIPELLRRANRYDMVVGARAARSVAIPAVRKPAKWFLGRLASYLAGRRIPDLNSGLRVIRPELVKRFAHLLPNGFSFTTTITLAALCNGYAVHYQPIDYRVRIGESKIRAAHAFQFLVLVLRTIVYFNPLKVFLPLGAALFAVGSAKLVYDVFLGDVSESAVMGILSACLVWGFGLLSDQMSRLITRPESS